MSIVHKAMLRTQCYCSSFFFSYLTIRVPHNFCYFTYGSSVDVHLFLNCHLLFELFWHLYYWLVTFHQPVILHKDIRHRIVETVNTLKV